MPELQFSVEPPRARVDIIRWVARIALGLFFIVVVGGEKFAARSPFIRIFDQIGLGQWFRYFTGGMQVAGGILFMVPRLTIVGAAMLACTLVGATFVNLFILRTGWDAAFPALLLVIVAGVTWFGRRSDQA